MLHAWDMPPACYARHVYLLTQHRTFINYISIKIIIYPQSEIIKIISSQFVTKINYHACKCRKPACLSLSTTTVVFPVIENKYMLVYVTKYFTCNIVIHFQCCSIKIFNWITNYFIKVYVLLLFILKLYWKNNNFFYTRETYKTNMCAI